MSNKDAVEQLSMLPVTELHCHTISSDGLLNPQELVQKAAESAVCVLAVTDHDTTDATLEVRRLAEEKSIETLTGVELTCSEKGQEIHLLAYCFDLNNTSLQDLMKDIRGRRVERARKILERLASMGAEISMEDVTKHVKGSSIVRPHIAAALHERGYVSSPDEAFVKYLHNYSPAYVAIPDLPVKDAIAIIRAAGGLSVLAHPSRMHTVDKIKEYMLQGLDGIEVYHPSHNLQATNNLRNFARKSNLIATGGSDFHGGRMYDLANFARFSIDLAVIERMKSLAAERHAAAHA